MSTVMPGVAGSEIVATTSPSRITLPADTNMSSNPPSDARSHVEPEAMMRNFGRCGAPGAILSVRSRFMTP